MFALYNLRTYQSIPKTDLSVDYIPNIDYRQAIGLSCLKLRLDTDTKKLREYTFDVASLYVSISLLI